MRSKFKNLSERFGEPIDKVVATVGAADNGPQGKALWNDEPKKDRHWSDPSVIDEAEARDMTCDQCGSMKTFEGNTDCTCESEMLPENLDEAYPDDFDNYDRTGSEDMQRVSTTPEAVASVVKDWFLRHQGKIDRPDTGNHTSLREITQWCIKFIMGNDEYDQVGSLWQIEQFLENDYLYYQELARELYGLISDPERL